MAKRLYMTSADYLAIAISPALIMALVGSLVYFLIEVLYVGQYQARLNYAFALFVFAAVLIARISIEMGSERAVLFALPLGIVMFLFLLRFVEHPHAFSHVINLALLAIVWWCAHQLTWDSTVIDDDEDASGEGLMQRIGVDGPGAAEDDKQSHQRPSTAGTKGNELLKAPESADLQRRPWWHRFVAARRGPHTPGLWVLYFSLAALPLFGIGQHWVPVAEVGRRRYVFALLLVYVAAALALLVTTSFLNLRRYLRQRHIEMPAPIAGTWVGVGAALIVVIMLLSALIPRPGAEIALSRVPWQAGTPGGLVASRTSVNRDGGEEQSSNTAATGEHSVDQVQGDSQQQDGGEQAANEDAGNTSDDSSMMQDNADSTSADGESSDNRDSDQQGEGSDTARADADEMSEQSRDRGRSGENSEPENSKPESQQTEEADSPRNRDETSGERTKQVEGQQGSPSPQSPSTIDVLHHISSSFGGLAGLFKIIFYIIVALLLGYILWKYRQQILQAIGDIWRQLRALFGGTRADSALNEADSPLAPPRRRSFSDFRDPFQTGQHAQWPPEELVRYTFAAFEAWANDRGRTRTPDCTPQELLGLALDPETPIYPKARRLVRLYGEVAYASRRIPRESVNELRELWQMMRNMQSHGAAVTSQQ
jgi:hypothetical protein